MSAEKEHGFWPDNISKELVDSWKAKTQVITTGTSMSGDPHIGNANDVIRGDAIRMAVETSGHKAELLWVSDDLDPFRSVPADMPTELEDYLGVPAAMIPDLWNDGHGNFVEHFEEKFLGQLERVKVKPVVMRGIDMYREGRYNDAIKVAMAKRGEIAHILNKFRGTKLGDSWYPIDVICEKCGRISTTKILSHDDSTHTVEYMCNPEEVLLHRKNPVSGCGYMGKTSLLNGKVKLTWRVEWPARWTFLGTTCEPFGKEHAAAGGSWDTGREIAEKIFGYRPPMPVIYEHFLVNGQKMSKSLGNVISVDDMLRYMLPEHLRYWMFQGRLTIAKDIVLRNIVPHVFEEFDRAEGAYFDKNLGETREAVNLRRAYELAIVNLPGQEEIIHVPFRVLENFINMYSDETVILNVLGKDFGATDKNMLLLKTKIALVMNYIRDFGGSANKIERKKLTGIEKAAVNGLIEVIKKTGDSDLQQEIYNYAKAYAGGVKGFFKLAYNILLGADAGPRLGDFIMQKGKKEILEKLENV